MSESGNIATAVKILSRTFARFCLRRGIRLHEALESLKQSFVEEAADELRRMGAPQSASRISVMTGVHRKDIARLTESPNTAPDRSLLSRIIGQWLNDPRFSKRGKPLPLRGVGRDGEFAELVASVSKELIPSTILAELLRLGAVSQVDEEIQLLSSVYVPRPEDSESFAMIARDSEDLWEAVQENLREGDHTRNFHIKTEFDAIPDEYLDEIRLFVLKLGTRFHERVQRFLSRYDKDINRSLAGKPGRNRVCVVGFSRIESERQEGEAPSPSDVRARSAGRK